MSEQRPTGHELDGPDDPAGSTELVGCAILALGLAVVIATVTLAVITG